MNKLGIFLIISISFGLSFDSIKANTIAGKVIDANENTGLAGANVEILNTKSGTATDKNGKFIIADINPGRYMIQVSYIGYKTITKEINISIREKKYINIYLKPKALEGESIIITAPAEPNRAIKRESPVAFTRLGKIDLIERHTTGDVAEMVKNVPGVWTASAGLGESEIYLRGFSAHNINFMINDIPISSPEDGQVIWSDWAGLSYAPLSVEIQRGPGYSLTGSNAAGGTINITTLGVEDKRTTQFRFSSGFYNRDGIQSGPDAGKMIDPSTGEIKNISMPFNYSYFARFNSGWLYDGKLNLSFFLERRFGESYLQQTVFNGYTLGLEAESIINDHKLHFIFFIPTQFHEQAFALQDIDLLNTLGREYNRKTHDWQENFFTKVFTSFKHKWQIEENRSLTNYFYYILGRGADQTCTNDAFDVNTGVVGFQPTYRGQDAYSFGVHAQYLYYSYGLMTSFFSPASSDNPFRFRDIPFVYFGAGVNFFADQKTHSYQQRRRRDHDQFGLISSMTHIINQNIQLNYGFAGSYWIGHHESQSFMLKVSEIESLRPLWSEFNEEIFIPKVQSVYDYETQIFNLSPFGRITWKPRRYLTLQSGAQVNYSLSKVDENPIKLIDFGTWNFFNSAKRTSADIYSYNRTFSTVNDYQRQYFYLTPWLGANYNINQNFNVFSRIANSKKEPAINDWYDYSNGPLPQKKGHPEDSTAVSLQPESATSFELGINYQHELYNISTNYYYTYYADKIESVLDIDGRRKTLNAGQAIFQGIEFSVFGDPGDFDYQVSATLARNRWQKMNVREIFDSDAKDVVGKVVPFAPERMFSGNCGYTYKINVHNQFHFEIGLNYWDEYYGTYTNKYSKTIEQIIDEIHYKVNIEKKAKLPYFLELNANVSYLLRLKDLDFNFRIHANNILNRSDNFMKAQYSIDYTRNDFQAGRYNWYVLQAPLFNLFFTMEISIKE